MARFRFRLQAVLDHREMQEHERQRAVAALERERVRLEQLIRDAQRSIMLEQAELRAGLASGDLHTARRQSAAASRFLAEAQRAAVELAGVHKRLLNARAALLEAAKDRKAVELLRDRHFQSWISEENRREAAAVDELVVMRAGRKDHP
jgi:flagellar protein FliJ